MNIYPALLLVLPAIVVGAAGLTAQTAPEKGQLKPIVKSETPIEDTVTVETPDGKLFGTLIMPRASGKVPIVLLIAGSGPTDRDGNSPALPGPNNSLKLLAEGLAKNGIATLRYDKRGVGESGKEMIARANISNKMPDEADLTFEHYIDDAVLWVRKLRADPRVSSVTVAGHSEGSLIGMVAARKAGADAFISIAGAGRPVRQILAEQLRPMLPPALMASAESIMVELAAGKTVDPVPPELNVVFRRSVQPYMISWLRYDPAKEIAKLTIPVLVVHGTTDIQATSGDAELLARSNKGAKTSIIDGMNHVFKTVPSDRVKQIASYSDPSLPVEPKLINEIGDFVKASRK